VDKNAYKRISLFWLTGVFLLVLFGGDIYGQETDPGEAVDTSYFKAGEDDWNLVESVMKENPEAVILLLKRGADPNAKAEGGMTALMFAAERGVLLMVKMLVLNGADPELTYMEGAPPPLLTAP